MADWAGRLLPASFRGLPFFVEAHELSGGRNIVPHEPPDRNDVFTEDVGRKTKVFSIDGHVLGDTYMFLRDGLIDAMEDDSVGILIHPYLGPKEVRPGPYSVRESTTEGRIAHFTFQFMEAGTPSSPLALIDAVTDFITDVANTVAKVQNAFQVAFAVAGLPGFVLDSAVAVVNGFTSTIRNGLIKVGLKNNEFAALNSKLDQLDEEAETLIRYPASLAYEVDVAIGLLRDVVVDPPDRFTIDSASGRDDSVDVFTDLLSFSAETPEPVTPTREQEAANTVALVGMITQLSTIRLSEQVVAKAFNTLDEAVALRDKVSDKFESQLLSIDSDELYGALSILNSKFIQAVPNKGTSFATTGTIVVDIATPAILLAYDLYGSEVNEQDIIDRNGIRNPAFITGEIEVISGG